MRRATTAGACDELDPRLCLLPLPNDHFTALDDTTPTGRRVDLSPLATPRNVAGKPADPTEWNRNDGFSPGSMVLTHVPGLDLTTTFGLDPTPETGVGTDQDPFATRDADPDAVIEAPELSMAPDVPIVLLDADTGERQLGDTDLGDLQVEGQAPPMTVTGIEEGTSDGFPTRTVHGTVTVPNYLTSPRDGIDTSALDAAEDAYDQLPAELRDADPGAGDLADLAGEVPVVAPQSRFVYDTPAPGPMAVPQQNPAVPTTEAEFTCKFRTDLAGGAKPTLYGHGLLGGRGETEGSSTGDLRRGGHAMRGVDWIGMATEDITNVALILHDISFFPSLADRAQQGFLNFLYVGRALIHPDGAVAQAAFRDADGTPLLDTDELFYDDNSQGGIMGGPLTAVAPDFTKSVLGVPGINYSTLLNRSVDWEGEFLDPTDPGIPAYGSFHYNAYPNTPAHQVLLEVAFGDYQVTNHAAEVEARTIGADFLGTALAPGRHWERDYATGGAAVPFGLDDLATADNGVRHAPSGSAIVYWDSGNPTPPNANVPPADLHEDPHGDPRKDDAALVQKLHFYDTGWIVDVNDGQPNWTTNCRHPEYHPGC